VPSLEVLEAQIIRLHAERTGWADRVTVARLEADQYRGELRSANIENGVLRGEIDRLRKAVGALQALMRSRVWLENEISTSLDPGVDRLKRALELVPVIDRRSRKLADVYGLEHEKSPVSQ
jgi:hypothetical protein